MPQLEATETVLVPCSPELVGMLDTIGRLLKTDTPGLCYRYIVEGLQRDVGHVYGMQLSLDKTLREALSFFKSETFLNRGAKHWICC